MKTQRSTPVKYFAFGSFGCVLIFAALVIILHGLRPQLNPLSHTVSEYALGPFGFLMTIAFLMRGLGELFLVLGLALGTMRRSRSWTGLVLLALSSVFSFLVATFPVNFQNISFLLIHSLSAFLGFCCLAIAALVWSGRLRKDPLWRSSSLVSLILGLLMLFSLLSLVVSASSLQGLTERVFEAFAVFWLGFMAWRLSTLTSSKTLSPAR